MVVNENISKHGRGGGYITYKTDAGTLEYTNSSRPFQITGQTNFPSTVDTDLRTATFTSFERPKHEYCSYTKSHEKVNCFS